MRKEKKYCKFLREQEGINIPMPVLEIDNLNEIERFLLSITYNYTKQKDDKSDNGKGLITSNAILSDFLGCSPMHISKSFKKLENMSLIEIKSSRNNSRIKNVIFDNLPRVESKTNKKGIWIPKKYIYAESIDNIQKILISEFESFYNDKKIPIRAGDRYFADLIKRSPKTVNNKVNDLRHKKYIKVKHIYDSSSFNIFQRLIYFNPSVTVY